MIATVVKELGGLDLLVNGAAGNFPRPRAGLSPNGFRTVIDIDLVELSTRQAAFPLFRSATDSC